MRYLRPAFLAAMLVAVAAAAFAATPTPSEQANALFAEYWEWQMKEFPVFATATGDHRYDDRLPDVSAAAIARRKADGAAFAKRLAAIDRNALTAQEAVSVAVLATTLDHRARIAAAFAQPGAEGADAWSSVTQFNGPQVGFASLPGLVRITRFESLAD
jgi:uncharacterized protein (DUF885 family)